MSKAYIHLDGGHYNLINVSMKENDVDTFMKEFMHACNYADILEDAISSLQSIYHKYEVLHSFDKLENDIERFIKLESDDEEFITYGAYFKNRDSLDFRYDLDLAHYYDLCKLLFEYQKVAVLEYKSDFGKIGAAEVYNSGSCKLDFGKINVPLNCWNRAIRNELGLQSIGVDARIKVVRYIVDLISAEMNK